MALSLFITDKDSRGMPWFWRNPDGWVFRLTDRLWLVKEEE